jgi:hypothetical protein
LGFPKINPGLWERKPLAKPRSEKSMEKLLANLWLSFFVTSTSVTA